ncbi:MAG TPA: Mur ligase domain-containing protein [Chitinophagaceae bacterium]|nr:Mur ligase domain-containing protein [Chitinophagaceae bacterium]
MIKSVHDFNQPFFIGIAGAGMSAIAQYLKEAGKNVSGSDRFFSTNEAGGIREKLEAAGISCFPQDGSGIGPGTDLIVVSTAVEDSVPEVKKAKEAGIPILKRSELLALIVANRKTIAVGGTSGKSTTSAMLFDILRQAGMEPGIISGAGLTRLIKEGKTGNAAMGKGEWLVIEADESDGSIVQYHPAIGLLLNVDKDHKEIEVLMDVFMQFRNNSDRFIVNQSHPLAASLSANTSQDFSTDADKPAGYLATGF